MPLLRYELDGKVHEFDLKDASTTIGRDRGNGLQIKDKSMSRTHCRIDRTETGWKVVDLASRNGTFVNGEKFPEKELKPGDVVKIGNIPVTFEPPARAEDKKEPPRPGEEKREPPRLGEEKKEPPRLGEEKRASPSQEEDRKEPPRQVQRQEEPPLLVAEEAVPTLEAIPDEVRLPPPDPAPRPPEPPAKPKTLRREESEPRAPRSPRGGLKPSLVAGLLGVALLGVGAVLFVLYRNAEAAANHARVVRTRLKEAVDEINRLSASDSIARDAMTEKLLADPEYEKVAPEVMKQLAIEHEKLHAAAEADRKAAKFVEPFLEKVAKAKENRETWASAAQELFEESRALLQEYGAGGYADRLLGVSTELKLFLEKKK